MIPTPAPDPAGGRHHNRVPIVAFVPQFAGFGGVPVQGVVAGGEKGIKSSILEISSREVVPQNYAPFWPHARHPQDHFYSGIRERARTT